jgi:hypothetical protein
MPAVTKTIFRDLVKRNQEARHSLGAEKAALVARPHPAAEEEAELARISALLALAEAELLDPLFGAVRDSFNDDETRGLLSTKLGDHKKGVLQAKEGELSDDDVVRIAFVLGVLAGDQVNPPRLRVEGKKAVVDTTDPGYGEFTVAFYAALGRARGSFALARLVLPILQAEGDRDARGGSPGEVETTEFAALMACLRSKGITESEPQLRRRVNECLDKIQSVGVVTSVPQMAIALPNFNQLTDYQIQAGNVEAMGPMICAAMFDELKAFEVVDKIVEAAQMGTLTTGLSDAGAMIYDYWKSAPNRMSDSERKNFYALTMGIPGGSVNGSANRDFNDLWIRFVSSVSALIRQKTADQILRANIPAAVSQQQVRKAARDLAANLSLHGYGMVQYAARDLQDQISKMINLLGHKDILRAYGALDMWQVIDQVATLELGGARNSARYRSLATCGAIITRWLSQNIKKFNSSTTLQKVIDVDAVLSTDPPSAGKDATQKPTDYDLVNACELWLADTAVSDERVEEMAQPRESPAMTSRPVQIPAIAREILDQALPPGLGLGMQRR